VRQLLRAELVAAFSDWSPGMDPAAALARFDEATLGLEGRWPLLRFVEELTRDGDPAVARAAIRLLGRRGDRISALALSRALPRAELGKTAVAALGELGTNGLDGLSVALEDPRLAPGALERLAAIGGSGAARIVERSLIARGVDLARDEGRVGALASMGSVALEPLLRLARRGGEARRICLGRIERLPGAADALAGLLRGAPGHAPGHAPGEGPGEGPGDEKALLLEAAVRLPSAGALSWVEEQCLDSEWRDRALATLARWEGVEPLEALIRLSATGRLPDERILATARELLGADPGRAAALAREVARGAPEEARGLLELVVACDVPRSGGACALLAGSDLHEDERQWAALAAGDLGEPADAATLVELFRHTDPGERRLRAAILLSIHRLGGEESVVRALGLRHGRAWERLDRALAEADERGAAVALHRVVRALDEVRRRFPRTRSST